MCRTLQPLGQDGNTPKFYCSLNLNFTGDLTLLLRLSVLSVDLQLGLRGVSAGVCLYLHDTLPTKETPLNPKYTPALAVRHSPLRFKH